MDQDICNRHISNHTEWLVEQLPAHETYIETHAHRGTLLLAKEPSRNEVINDPNGDFTTLYETIRSDRPSLVEFLCTVDRSPENEDAWRVAFELGERPSDPITRTGQFLCITPGCFPNPHRSDSDERSVERFQQRDNVNSQLNAVVERLEEVIIDNRNFIDVAEQYSHGDACYFINPTGKLHRRNGTRDTIDRDVYIPTYIAEWDHSQGTPYYVLARSSTPMALEPWPTPTHGVVTAVRNFGFEFTDAFCADKQAKLSNQDPQSGNLG